MLKSLRLIALNNPNKNRISVHNALSYCTKTEKTDSEKQQKDVEYEFNPRYLNKNPRNLEWSGHAYKRMGWHLQYPPKDFYHE